MGKSTATLFKCGAPLYLAMCWTHSYTWTVLNINCTIFNIHHHFGIPWCIGQFLTVKGFFFDRQKIEKSETGKTFSLSIVMPAIASVHPVKNVSFKAENEMSIYPKTKVKFKLLSTIFSGTHGLSCFTFNK